MNKRKKLKDIILLSTTGLVLLFILIFCIINWHVVLDIFLSVISSASVMREYMLSIGIVGVIAIMLVMIVLYFFPVVSSIPLQIASLIAYGLLGGTIISCLSVAIGSQLFYLFGKNFETFYSESHRAKHKEVEKRIQNSNRSITLVLILAYFIPCIPYLIISSLARKSRMKWWKYTLFNTIGPIPGIFATLVLGKKVAASSALASVILLAAMIILVVLSFIYQEKLINFIFKPKKVGEENE